MKKNSLNYMKDITAATIIKTAGSESNLLAQESKLSSQHQKGMLYMCGENSLTIQVKKALIVRSLEMNPQYCRQPLSVRLAPLLLSFGLVKGTTLTFGKRLSNLGIPAGVSYAPDGERLVIPRAASLF